MEYTRKRRRKAKHEWSDWIQKALQILKPADQLSVSDWSDRYRILDSKTSSEPGTWNTNRTPYLREIMNAFLDPDIEEIIFMKATQIGGTEGLNNIVAYVIAQDQSPTLIVYPTLNLAEFTSKNRIQPMIELSPELKVRYRSIESKMTELQFDGMYVVLSGANSPSSLSSRPIRYLFMDEVDKYPTNSGKEADPRSLARERTKTFPHNKKIFQTSTPTIKSGPINQEFENADAQKRYYIPCPHCGHYQTFRFKQLKWNNEIKEPEEAAKTAYYECEECKGIITDSHKMEMVRNGEWRYEKNNGTKKTAYHISAFYSPWLRFGDIAYEFLRSKDYPELLMNFVNSWLAEPWEQTEIKMDSDKVLERQSEYDEGVVPDGALLITAGVDVQRDHFYYTVRAWGTSLTSWNIAHGVVSAWSDIEEIMNIQYQNRNGQAFQVNLCAVDSGDRTDEVYDFCVYNQDWAVPVKGSSRPLLARYSMSTIDKVNSKAFGMRLYIVDGAQYKNMIAGRLNRPNGQGSWMVFNECDREYADQICSEEKVLEKRGGRDIEVWKPKTSHAANHYLDAEVYAALAADLLHVRYIQEGSEQSAPVQQQSQKESGFIKSSDDWIKNKGGWIR
ncbi:MAG TPA: phage terminase large subunit family protein [Negativicutes bacterium]|nr:phage terminase large subunit family protein [Negativicutes bacterium]